MPEIGRAEWKLEGNDQHFNRVMDKAESRIRNFGSGLSSDHFGRASQSVSSHLSSIVTRMDALRVASAAVFGSLAKDAFEVGFGFNAMKEQAGVAFTTLMGSSKAAQMHMDELFAFAAQTPFETKPLLQASQRLQAMGFHASAVVPMLTSVGDAVASMGGGAAEIEGVTRALTQMQAKGKVSAEEMLQLAERGIPAWQILADKLGISIPEAMKKSEKGAIDAGTAINALVSGMGERFSGMMEKQSHTFSGLVSTISDSGKQLIAGLMEPMFNSVRDGMQSLVNSLPAIQSGIQSVLDTIKVPFVDLASLVKSTAVDVAAQFQGIGGAASRLWDGLKSGFASVKPIIETVKTTFHDLAVGVAGVVSDLIGFYDRHRAAFEAQWGAAVQTIKTVAETIKSQVEVIIGVVRTGIKIMSGDFSGAWEFLKKTAEAYWSGLKNLVSNSLSAVGSIFSAGWEAIKSAASVAWDGLSKLPGLAWEGIKSGVSFIVNSIADYWKALPGFIGDAIQALPGIVGTIIGYAAKAAITAVGGLVVGVTKVMAFVGEAVWGGIKKAGEFLITGAKNLVEGAWEALKDLPSVFTRAVDSVFSYLASVPGKMLNFGIAAGTAFVEGITGAFAPSLGGFGLEDRHIFEKIGAGAGTWGKKTGDAFGSSMTREIGIATIPGGAMLAQGLKAMERGARPAALDLGAKTGKALKDAFIEQLNEWLSETDKGFKLSRAQFDSLEANTRANLTKAAASWVDFRNTFLRVSAEIEGGNTRMQAALNGMVTRLRTAAGDFTYEIKNTASEISNSVVIMPRIIGGPLQKVIDAMAYAANEAKLRLARIPEAIKESFAKIPSLVKLNFTLDISSTITNQLEQLARTSGQSFEKVASDFRNMVTAAGAMSPALTAVIADIDRQIIESRLGHLDDAWGKPLGTAIAGILGHFGKLQDAAANVKDDLLAKVTAIGNLFGALPGKIGASINKVIGEINKWLNLAQKALAVLDAFGLKIPGTLGKILDAITGNAQSTARVMADMKAQVETTIKAMADEVVKIMRQMVSDMKDEMGKLPGIAQQAGQQTASNLTQGMSGLPSSIGDILGKVGGVFGGTASGIIKAIESIINATRNLGATLPPIYSHVGNAATQMGTQISIAMNNAATATQAANASMSSSTARMAAGVMGILGGLATFVGSRNQGLAKGMIGGAMGGASVGAGIGLMVGGPVGAGIGALIGAAGGAILGIFGSGKTELQKAQEAAQLASARESIKQGKLQTDLLGEQLKQSYIDTVDKVKNLAESLRHYTSIGKEAMQAFWKDAGKLFAGIAEQSALWKEVGTAEMKEAAENLSAGVGLIANLPAVLAAIGSSFSVSDSKLASFFTSADRFFTRLGEFAEAIPRKLTRSIRQFQERIGDGLTVVEPIINSIKGLFDLPDVPLENFDRLENGLQEITARLGRVAESADKDMVHAIEFFASRIMPGVELWKATVETFKSMFELQMPDATVMGRVFTGLQDALARSLSIAANVSGEALNYASAVWERARSIFDTVKSGVDLLKSVAEAKWPDAAAWTGFNDGVSRMTTAALESLQRAIAGRDAMAQLRSVTADIKDDALASAMNLSAAASAMTGAASGIAGSSFNVGLPGATVAPHSPPLPLPNVLPRGGGSQGRETVRERDAHIHFHGPVIGDETQIRAVFKRVYNELKSNRDI